MSHGSPNMVSGKAGKVSSQLRNAVKGTTKYDSDDDEPKDSNLLGVHMLKSVTDQ